MRRIFVLLTSTLFVWSVSAGLAGAQGASLGRKVVRSGGRTGIRSAADKVGSSNNLMVPVSSSVRKTVSSMHPILPSTVSPTDPLIRRVVQARETTKQPTNLYSGTVFQMEYNGHKEVYIAVAAHALVSDSQVLHKRFTIDVYIGEGKYKSVEVEIVQVSAPSMLDIAIGKILEGGEELVPFAISHTPLTAGQEAVSYGFAGQKMVIVPNRSFLSETPLCVRTTMPYPRTDRPGLCGSALVDEETGELLGVHTGSSYETKKPEQEDVGHATKASLLEVLVDAFHHGGEGTFPLVLGGQKVLDMPVDGYISEIRLLNDAGKPLWRRGFESKFAYDQVNEQISRLSPRYIELTVRRVLWEGDQLIEVRKSWDRTRRSYRYDLQEGRMVWASKPKEPPSNRRAVVNLLLGIPNY
ncbi:MAG: hypothetical protein IKP96_06830 [Elusimicrobiaceae bacterium]|nr:hypothetical protein [Elusimicrobiaceae bacterium]